MRVVQNKFIGNLKVRRRSDLNAVIGRINNETIAWPHAWLCYDLSYMPSGSARRLTPFLKSERDHYLNPFSKASGRAFFIKTNRS
jgi:hypothetical protein